MKIKLGDLTVKQISTLCTRQKYCTGCPIERACSHYSVHQYALDASVEIPDDLLQKPISLCKYRNEDKCGMYCSGFDISCEDYKPVEEE